MSNKVQYWLFVTNEINWRTIKKKDMYGFNERSKKYMANLNKGDFVVIYVTGNMIGGLFKIQSLVSNPKANFEYGNYSYKIALTKVLVKKESLDIKPLVPNISIFRGMSRWGGALMGKSVRKLSKEDYRYIKEKLKED